MLQLNYGIFNLELMSIIKLVELILIIYYVNPMEIFNLELRLIHIFFFEETNAP